MKIFTRKKKKYSEAELLAFANYVLSDERTNRVKQHPEFKPDDVRLQIRLNSVSHADLSNWIDKGVLHCS